LNPRGANLESEGSAARFTMYVIFEVSPQICALNSSPEVVVMIAVVGIGETVPAVCRKHSNNAVLYDVCETAT
jgi:hypothetical protein